MHVVSVENNNKNLNISFNVTSFRQDLLTLDKVQKNYIIKTPYQKFGPVWTNPNVILLLTVQHLKEMGPLQSGTHRPIIETYAADHTFGSVNKLKIIELIA